MTLALRGKLPKDTFGGLLQIPNNSIGTEPKQLADGEGNLLPVRINKDHVSLDKVATYKMVATDSTGVCDLSIGNVFRISAASNRTIAFTNVPDASTSMTVVIVVSGSTGAFTWPVGIFWEGGTAPTFGANRTVVTLLWDGSSWIGATSIKS